MVGEASLAKVAIVFSVFSDSIFLFGICEKKNYFILEKRVRYCFFGKSRLVFIVNLIRFDLFLWKYFHLLNIPTISIDSESMTCTFP